VPAPVLEPAFNRLELTGHLRYARDHWELTESGREEFAKVVRAWHDWLASRLGDWGTGNRAELDAAIGRVAARLLDQSTEVRAYGRHALA